MTSTVQTSPGFTREAFEAFLAAREEPAWLGDLRREGWEHFEAAELPQRRGEEWARTDLRGLKLDQFALGPAAPEAADRVRPLLSAGVELAGEAVSANGHGVRARLDGELARRGVVFGDLDRLAGERQDVLRPHLEARVVDPRYDKFSALSAALWSGGQVLYVPRGVTIDRPLHMLSALAPGGSDVSRSLVVLEEGAEATVLAETASSDAEAAGLHCGTIELIVKPGARLRYVNLQNWGSGVWHFAHQRAHLGRAGAVQWTIGALGGRLAKVNQHVELAGEDAEAQVNGVMFTQGRQHLAYHTLQHHSHPYCRSDLLYKGALQDKSRLVWRGMIHVEPDAQRTDGYQRNDNLLLSDTARVDSIPGLEIQADDVRCTHGATLGRVDDELLFYAQSRGLTRREAARMIVGGFFQQVFDRITIESVRHALAEAIGRRVREFES